MNCKYVFRAMQEKFMEWIHTLQLWSRNGKEYKSNLVEVYKIKREHINEDFVKEFLKERQRAVAPKKYRIEIIVDDTSAEENVIGSVTLLRKKKIIEHATLVTKKNDRESEKLIYWRF